MMADILGAGGARYLPAQGIGVRCAAHDARYAACAFTYVTS